MNLGFDVRGGIEKLPSALEAMIARINTIWKKEHNIDGTHGSMTVSGDLDVTGDLTVNGQPVGGPPVVGPPLAHAPTHNTGGSDPITALSGSVITTGTVGAARLGVHAPSHNTGGSDPVTALSGAVITTGTVPDARLSSNVALKNIDNNFTTTQNVSGGVTATGVIQTTNNVQAGGAIVSSLYLYANSGLIEYGRPFVMGDWNNVPFNAANFTANGGGTWTVGSATVIINRYTIIGRTMVWSFYISWFSGSNTVAGTVVSVRINHPAGVTAPTSTIYRRMYGVSGGAVVDVDIAVDSTAISIAKTDGANISAGAFGLIGTVTFEIG